MPAQTVVRSVPGNIADRILAHVVVAADRHGLSEIKPMHGERILRFHVGNGTFSAVIPVEIGHAAAIEDDRELSLLIEGLVTRAVGPFVVGLARAA